MQWVPSNWGKKLTRSSDWCLKLNGWQLELSVGSKVYEVIVGDESAYSLRKGLLWTDITLEPGTARTIQVDGLPNAQFEGLRRALDTALMRKRLRDDELFLDEVYESVHRWLDLKSKVENNCRVERRWLTHEQQQQLLSSMPKLNEREIRLVLSKATVSVNLAEKKKQLEHALADMAADHVASWVRLNASHVEQELVACKDLFDRVESKPLTAEQARTVACFDNRVQVIASAGSGKTSTMVAKAAYAIHRGLVQPARIVMLAFNKQAAQELQERANLAFERLGMGDVTVEASTFHALGLKFIGKATNEKPDLPDWATDAAAGIQKLSEIVDQLKDQSSDFARQWDMFRLVFGRSLPPFGVQGSFDAWDDQGNGSLITLQGERVKSQEELLIANFLFLNGVKYVYEAPYEHSTATQDYRQYHPDFYYPDIDLYHEHFALDAQGQPPVEFKNYLEGVYWKRQLHADMATDLFETTSHGLRNGNDFERLAQALTSRGLVLDPNPDREIPIEGLKPMESIELIGLIRTFMSHAKSNSLSIATLQERVDAIPKHAFKHRYQMFLDIAAPIMKAWDAALAAEKGIDFEDMLNQAADLLESHRVESPYDLVMADEFQDASRARARLCRALVHSKGKFFFAVGDDWQSINRFAGADVAVMTGFKTLFGHGQVLKLEQTFRCPQELCDLSSTFVSKNPAQIPKQVRSSTPAYGSVLEALQVTRKEELASAIEDYVMRIAYGVQDGSIAAGHNGKVSIYILGRYNADKQYLPKNPRRFSAWVDISFLTIHRSKGSEADYVILPEMVSALRGRSFPNTRVDDPVLSLAMPDGDDFMHSEERRLFYVALTRARRSVAIFTVQGRTSTFLQELCDSEALTLTNAEGQVIQEQSCPACKQGVMLLRTGPYGAFQSCSNFPLCRYKPKKGASVNKWSN